MKFGIIISALFCLNLLGCRSGQTFVRTELYFGCAIPTGGQVSDGDWQNFLDTAISRRFPDGLSVVSVLGQWKDSETGATIQEPSKMVILFYPKGKKMASDWFIEEIRASYCSQFNQQAVMRVDSRSKVWFAPKRKNKPFY